LTGHTWRYYTHSMRLPDIWRELDDDGRKRFAQRAGTTTGYIQRHLIRVPPTRTITPRLLNGLVRASDGQLTHNELYKHFYETSELTNPNHNNKKSKLTGKLPT